ncbi:MAG: signal peptidase I [Chitinophagaceae bacterium]|nr:signal peptidase I [Chitinophagaceae bacterium]
MGASKKVKYWIIAASIAGICTLVLVAGRLLGWWGLFTIRSPSQMPELVPGTMIIGGNLQAATTGRFVLFRVHDEVEQQQAIYLFRCVAQEGDTVQLRSGRCYVNGRMIDDSSKIWLTYELETERPLELLEAYGDRNDQIFPGERLSVPLSPVEAAALRRRLTKFESLKLQDYPLRAETSWLARIDSSASINDCNAFVIPARHLFVLGANRHNARDSRFTGPIHQDSVVGVTYFR